MEAQPCSADGEPSHSRTETGGAPGGWGGPSWQPPSLTHRSAGTNGRSDDGCAHVIACLLYTSDAADDIGQV